MATGREPARGQGRNGQEYFAMAGYYKLRSKVALWGEEDLRINGRKISQVGNARDRRQAFRELATTAEQYLNQ